MDEETKKGKKDKKAKKEKPDKEKKPGSKKKLLLILALLVVAGGAAAAYFFLFPKSEEQPVVYAYYSPGDYFVVNVKDSSRWLKATIVLVLNTDDADLQESMTERNSEIRDVIIFLLRDLDEEYIESTDTKDDLRENIIEQLNQRLEIDNIVGVTFNDFVMQ